MTDRLPHVLATTPDEPDGCQFCHEEWDAIFTSHENDECPARLRLRIEELEGLLDGAVETDTSAATEAFDAIAKLCGCEVWEYPGQLVRDVQAVVEARDSLTLQCAEPPHTLSALLLTCEQLPEAVLFECYGIERDCEAPLDKALLAWKDAGCPR